MNIRPRGFRPTIPGPDNEISGPGSFMNIRSRDWIRPHDVISWILFQKNFKNIIQNLEECLPYVYVYATSSCDKNLHFTTIIFVNTALSYLTLQRINACIITLDPIYSSYQCAIIQWSVSRILPTFKVNLSETNSPVSGAWD